MKNLYLELLIFSLLLIQIYAAFIVPCKQLNVNSITSREEKGMQNPFWYWVSRDFLHEAQRRFQSFY
jgi:hypothetical protein